MQKTAPIEPLVAGDDEIRAMVQDAQFPALLPALALLRRDLSLLRPDLMPDPLLMGMPQAGLTDDQLTAARRLAVDALVAWRDAGSPAPVEPTEDELFAMMSFAAAGTITREYLPLLREELALGGVDLRAPSWTKDELAPDRPFHVVIVGAGMSGLLAAHRLQQAGVPFTILEKNHDVGGTWYENLYPGCRVDVPNHSYSYSFAQKLDWPQLFSTQDVLLDYFRQCADEFGLRRHIRFDTEVTLTEFDEAAGVWRVHVRRGDGAGAGGAGPAEVLEANALVVAVGQLNRPKMPDIAGMERFAGPSFHSAEWDHGVDLTGKRVCVIGTGCSALQFLPEIAPKTAHLTIFQRTPGWLAPTPDYHDTVPEGLQWLFRHVPTYSEWYRFFLFWQLGDGALEAVRVDPSYAPFTEAVGPVNAEARALLLQYLDEQFGDRPDLRAKLTPHYPLGAKRGIRDNGVWARTLKLSHVQLDTSKISEITAEGVVTADGVLHACDVIIYGTGFQASRFLTPMRVVGRGGADLHREWDGDARAHLGVTVPGFPNLFLLYGPNTNIVVNGSIIFFSECEVRLVQGAIELLLREGHAALDTRREAHQRYNERIDEGNRNMAWGVATVNSWYRNDNGRIAQNWPFSLLEFWRQTLRPDPADYELL